MRYELYEVVRTGESNTRISSAWFVQMKHGRWPFRTKRAAQEFADGLKAGDMRKVEAAEAGYAVEEFGQ